ncbi:hypothetical protein JRQ81_015537 [Phrynocephalus forsythii]|uniref:Podocalyxin n=1 Tax=Phrynocephalus forsythii TaxID=171643 RepID=A0A9Q0XU29_9SAUR|nr:hypothetical protein JRQ81_015537 [Phrynocephalus forsythii]
MRPALQLLLLLLACLGCGVGSTTVSNPTTSPAVTPAATEAKSTGAATITKPSTTTVGSSSSATGTTRQASSAPAVSPVATTGVGATTLKGTTQSLGAVSTATSRTTSVLTTAKPTSPSIADRSTLVTGATTGAKATVATSMTPLTTVTAGGSAPTIASSSDSSGKVPVTSLKPKETSPAVATTASKTLPTTALSTTSAASSSSSIAIPRSDAPAKVAGTGTPGGAVTTSDLRRTSPKQTTPTIPGRTKDGASTPTPAAVSTSSAGVPGSSRTVRTTASPPEIHGPVPTDGSHHQALCLANTKIVCESTRPPEYQGIRMTMNESRTCDSLETSDLKESLMNVFCKAVKPSFSQSRDVCTAVMASIAGHPQELAVLSISVTVCSKNDELSESLAVKVEELEKLGFSNFSYSGKPLDTSTKDPFGSPLVITIICMAASLLLVAAIYGCCHQRISRRKDQQRLTEELQTMENGYHDNPTLEVMETSAEMQEKKINLNGELGDSWIVPMDSLMKEDLEEEEEDTHL